MWYRNVVAVLLVVAAGCSWSYYEENLAAHIPRDDGTMLDVECVSSVPHDMSSITSVLQPHPTVTVILNERTFVVTANEIRLNNEHYADLAGHEERVEIRVTAEEITVQVDGLPVGVISQAGESL